MGVRRKGATDNPRNDDKTENFATSSLRRNVPLLIKSFTLKEERFGSLELCRYYKVR